MKSIRLQGAEFHSIKDTLTPKSYSMSKAGRIRVNYIGYKGQKYHHWLNPEEIAYFDMRSLPLFTFRDDITRAKIKEVVHDDLVDNYFLTIDEAKGPSKTIIVAIGEQVQEGLMRRLESLLEISVGDTVKILPDKGEGKVTHIKEGFYFLDNKLTRPYAREQLSKQFTLRCEKPKPKHYPDLDKCVDELKLLDGLPPYDYPNPTRGDNYAGHAWEKKYTEETKKEARRIVSEYAAKIQRAIRGVK